MALRLVKLTVNFGLETNDWSSARIVHTFSEDTIFRSLGSFPRDNGPKTRVRIEIAFKCRKLHAALSLARARLAADMPYQLSTKSRCPRVARSRRIGSTLAEIAGSGYAAMTRSRHRRWRNEHLAGTAAQNDLRTRLLQLRARRGALDVVIVAVPSGLPLEG